MADLFTAPVLHASREYAAGDPVPDGIDQATLDSLRDRGLIEPAPARRKPVKKEDKG